MDHDPPQSEEPERDKKTDELRVLVQALALLQNIQGAVDKQTGEFSDAFRAFMRKIQNEEASRGSW